jgi:hypothetical protein
VLKKTWYLQIIDLICLENKKKPVLMGVHGAASRLPAMRRRGSTRALAKQSRRAAGERFSESSRRKRQSSLALGFSSCAERAGNVSQRGQL